MQRSLGTPAKDLMPQVIQHTKEVAADQAAMEAFGEKIQKDKELANSRLHGNRKDTSREDERVRRVHDQVLKMAVSGGPPIKALRAEELVKVEKWEMSPGDVDGIFNSIVLPELRAAHDPRIFEYWDMKIKKESEAVKDKPSFDQEKYARGTLSIAPVEPREGIHSPRPAESRPGRDVQGREDLSPAPESCGMDPTN
jgi:hypothetical protein